MLILQSYDHIVVSFFFIICFLTIIPTIEAQKNTPILAELEEITRGKIFSDSNVLYIYDIRTGSTKVNDPSPFSFSTNSTTEILSNEEIFVTLTTCRAPLPKNSNSPPAGPLEIWVSTKVKNPGPKGGGKRFISQDGYLNATISKEDDDDGLFIGVFAPKLSDDDYLPSNYDFQIGASAKKFLHQLPTEKGLVLDDIDDSNALFRTANTSINQPSYKVYYVNYKFVNGISMSSCSYTQNILNSKNVTYITRKNNENFFQPLILLENLNNGTKYSMLVTEESVDGLKSFVPVAFQTQSQSNCQIIKDLEFCNKVLYSVPKTKTTNQDLGVEYDNLAKSYFQNFSLTIGQYPCEEPSSRYSLVRNCNDCREAYKDWICAITIPRCASEDSEIGNERNELRVKVLDESMELDQPFVELPPCLDLCYNITRSCPESFGFDCPKPDSNSTYGINGQCNSLSMNFSNTAVKIKIWSSIKWTLILLVIAFIILIIGI